jgi:hypothetical protein
MRSRVRFPVLPWGFFLEGEDPHGGHGLGSLVQQGLGPLVVLHNHTSPSTSSGQRNCASWASQPQKSVTLRPQPGGETTKSIRDMWWHWGKIDFNQKLKEFSYCGVIQISLEFYSCYQRNHSDDRRMTPKRVGVDNSIKVHQ